MKTFKRLGVIPIKAVIFWTMIAVVIWYTGDIPIQIKHGVIQAAEARAFTYELARLTTYFVVVLEILLTLAKQHKSFSRLLVESGGGTIAALLAFTVFALWEKLAIPALGFFFRDYMVLWYVTEIIPVAVLIVIALDWAEYEFFLIR
jgi:hypothetical protein